MKKLILILILIILLIGIHYFKSDINELFFVHNNIINKNNDYIVLINEFIKDTTFKILLHNSIDTLELEPTEKQLKLYFDLNENITTLDFEFIFSARPASSLLQPQFFQSQLATKFQTLEIDTSNIKIASNIPIDNYNTYKSAHLNGSSEWLIKLRLDISNIQIISKNNRFDHFANLELNDNNFPEEINILSNDVENGAIHIKLNSNERIYKSTSLNNCYIQFNHNNKKELGFDINFDQDFPMSYVRAQIEYFKFNNIPLDDFLEMFKVNYIYGTKNRLKFIPKDMDNLLDLYNIKGLMLSDLKNNYVNIKKEEILDKVKDLKTKFNEMKTKGFDNTTLTTEEENQIEDTLNQLSNVTENEDGTENASGELDNLFKQLGELEILNEQPTTDTVETMVDYSEVNQFKTDLQGVIDSFDQLKLGIENTTSDDLNNLNYYGKLQKFVELKQQFSEASSEFISLMNVMIDDNNLSVRHNLLPTMPLSQDDDDIKNLVIAELTDNINAFKNSIANNNVTLVSKIQGNYDKLYSEYFTNDNTNSILFVEKFIQKNNDFYSKNKKNDSTSDNTQENSNDNPVYQEINNKNHMVIKYFIYLHSIYAINESDINFDYINFEKLNTYTNDFKDSVTTMKEIKEAFDISPLLYYAKKLTV